MEGELLSELTASVGYVRLNRPDVHNAISRNMWDELPEEMAKLKRSGARVIVIAGQGASFAAGADLLELSKLADYQAAKGYWSSIASCLNSVAAFELPTIAMIRGACVGGGLLLAIACDLRYAADEATFALPTARLGIVLDDENIQRLVSLVGVASAKEILYLARSIPAAKAEQMGLINSAVNSNHLEQLVSGLTREIISNAENSIGQAKLSIARLVKNAASENADGVPQPEEAVVGSYVGDEFRKRTAQR